MNFFGSRFHILNISQEFHWYCQWVSGSPNVAVILVYVWSVMNTLGTIVLTTHANVCIIFPLVMVDLTKDMHLLASLHFGSLSLGR